MARKSYSDKEREQVKEALLITVLESIVNQGLVHSSIAILCEKVGISKTFFYSFFSSKEELVMQALRYQQPKLLRYAQELMNDPKLSWRESVKTFLKNCCYGEKVGFAVLSIEEEQQVYRCLSNENFHAFRNDQLYLYRNLLTIFGVPMDNIDPRLFGNLSLTMMMSYKAIPDTMPFLFPEVADDMVEFQINALLDEMQRAKKEASISSLPVLCNTPICIRLWRDTLVWLCGNLSGTKTSQMKPVRCPAPSPCLPWGWRENRGHRW